MPSQVRRVKSEPGVAASMQASQLMPPPALPLSQSVSALPRQRSERQPRDRTSEFDRILKSMCDAYGVTPEDVGEWAGHVAEVQVQNFMCHDNFHFQLGCAARVVLVCTHNSAPTPGRASPLCRATMAAASLLCCRLFRPALASGHAIQAAGRKRKTTSSRGAALQSSQSPSGTLLVRAVVCTCMLSTTFSGECTGDGAFRYEWFGPRITIKRTVRVSGSGELKLFDCTGKVVREPCARSV